MKSLYVSSLLGLVLAGCQIGDGLEDYYGDGVAPTVSGIDVTSVPGNTSGGNAVITGSGFGSDPEAVTVVFGQVNAKILEISDTSMTVSIPQGPVQGGAVDIRVGTTGGQASLDGGFTYDIGEGYENQGGYIVINNDWYSCYGGVGTASGCETFAYVGLTGITGRGEFLTETTFPRQHGMFTGYWGGADVTMGEWSVSKPAYNFVGLDIEDNIEDVRDKRIQGFTLRNPVYDELAANKRNFCADLSTLATWSYGGGDPVYDEDGNLTGVSDPVAVAWSDIQLTSEADTSEDSAGNQICADSDDRMFDVSEMRFCETWYDQEANTKAYQRAGTWVYDAEWPVGQYNFFAGREAIDDGDPTNVTIQVDVPEAGVDETIILPPWPYFTATAGIEDTFMGGQMWGVGTFEDCPDGNGDGSTSLDEAGVRFEWLPADLGDVVGGNIKGVQNTVRVSLNVFYLGWYGGEGITLRATTTVPDDNLVDPETGLAMVEVPADILLQFPTVDATLGAGTTGPFGTTFTWGDPARGDYGYLIVTLERVTEYTLEAPGLEGDLVVAYAAGDFGFYEWNNPLDSTDDCGDCQDGDGDGWTDSDDPDCEDPANGSEDNSTFGQTTCNDGLDNDGDGKIDAEDEGCEDGYDGETNCSDGEDNDGDGLIDGMDGECGPSGSGFELGEDDPSWQCNDGADNDADGWIDFDDPDCATASDEEVGFGATECNDGIDNDGHGDIDGADFICAFRGADYETEEPTRVGDCDNGLDDDGDGYVDRNDPDCELQPYSSERFDAAQSSWGWTSQCYNGVDDDGDGEIDALDLGCEDGSGVPDGYLMDESVADHPDSGGGDTGGSDTGS
ncbi:MAG: IPT/TIG domain-containing protein [Alphaproteobacteria bacterium]|nr:IPT/TIG domain-containing protein [Alphaproteobacteria bacterium]